MPYLNPKNQTRRQRHRRRVRDVKRVEIVLISDNDRDVAINDYLIDELPRGQAAEFIKQAIAEKIERERTTHDAPQAAPAHDTRAADQFNAILAELAALRATVAASARHAESTGTLTDSAVIPVDSSGIDFDAPRPRRSSAPTQNSAPERTAAPAASASAGIDMSAPRRRKTCQNAPQPPTLPEQPAPAFDADAAREALLNSIMAFGRDRR